MCCDKVAVSPQVAPPLCLSVAPLRIDGQMGRLLRWVTTTHSLRFHGYDHTRGEGHVYQACFKSFHPRPILRHPELSSGLEQMGV
jgi:hypothetical protein